MKRKPVPLFKIGAFVLAGFLLIIIFIFYIGSKEKLFSRTSEVRARFTTVNSLKKGAQVQMAGINVGSVKEILLPKNAHDSVTVTMKVIDNALNLIHTDSYAMISTEGIIGDKVVVITLGGDSSRGVVSGAMIHGEPSKDYGRVFDTINAAVSQVNALTVTATQLLAKIRDGNGTLGKLINDDHLYADMDQLTRHTQASIEQASNAVNGVATKLDGVTSNVNSIVERINRGEGSIGKLISKDDIYDNLKATSLSFQNTSNDIRDAGAKISLAAGRAAEIMEGFKHNFLLKGYFEDRGYWDVPEFEQTIDRKIDSLNRLRQSFDINYHVINKTK